MTARGLLPSLRPDPGTAHDWLERELAHAAYRRSLSERLATAVQDLLNRAGNAAGSLSDLGWPLLLGLLALLLGVMVAVLLRLQRNPAEGTVAEQVFDGVRRSAGEHRRRAGAAFTEGDHETAIVEATRALAAGLVERGLLADAPTITVHEVALEAARHFPTLAVRVERAALDFEEVRYGGRRADAERATSVLATERDVAGATPAGGRGDRTPVLAVPR